MEDHRDAYFFWKERNVRDAVCVHVDAHLDVCDRRVPGYSGVRPEVNCGNYLLPALNENVVTKLVWVVPPHLKQDASLLDWAREELQAWVHLTIAEYNSLRSVGSYVEGDLLGKPFIICESDNLPPLQGPVLLDIDADYYLAPDDGVWQTPLELKSHLEELTPQVITVAYSVQGGFTPLHRRYLGDLTVTAYQDLELAQAYQRCLTEPDSSCPDGPAWLQASHCLKDGLDIGSEVYRKAVSFDSQYEADLVDLAWWRLSRKDYPQAEEWIEKLPESLERDYLRGLACLYQKRFAQADTHWTEVLNRSDLESSTRRHLLELQSRALLGAEKYAQSEDVCRQALKLDRRDGDLWSLLAGAQYRAGKFDPAARSYRKAISCFKDKLEGLSAMLDLAQTYLDLGQREPALTQCRRVTKGDAPSLLKIQAEMIAMKARMRIPQ
jgi:tetratricopeptide (TPR) repeat protein